MSERRLPQTVGDHRLAGERDGRVSGEVVVLAHPAILPCSIEPASHRHQLVDVDGEVRRRVLEERVPVAQHPRVVQAVGLDDRVAGDRQRVAGPADPGAGPGRASRSRSAATRPCCPSSSTLHGLLGGGRLGARVDLALVDQQVLAHRVLLLSCSALVADVSGVLRSGSGDRGASGVRREPLERAGVGAGLDLVGEGRAPAAVDDRPRPARGRSRRAGPRRPASGRRPGRGPSRGAGTRRRGSTGRGRTVAVEPPLAAPRADGLLGHARTPSTPGCPSRGGRTSAPTMRADGDDRVHHVHGEGMAGEVRARRRLRLVVGREARAAPAAAPPARPPPRRSGPSGRARPSTRRDRRRRWSATRSSRSKKCTQPCGVARRPARRSGPRAPASRASRSSVGSIVTVTVEASGGRSSAALPAPAEHDAPAGLDLAVGAARRRGRGSR